MNKNFYGIDLGTTNSAISYFNGDESRIIKNRDQSDVTPSVVNINKLGSIKVGRKGKSGLIAHPEDTMCEFKRWMGTSNKMLFKSSGIEMDAEQLSAEILKSLLEDVNKNIGDNIENCVITVPIEFEQVQCEATIRAGNMAGLKNIYLLQEPISASIAYGYKESSSNKVWLVYDFGGGTFDAAIISTYNNKLTVVGHSGDNLLGGKDLDNEIVDKIILPKINKVYSIETLDKVSLKRRLSQIVEDAKIELTYSDKVEIPISEIGEDDYADEIELSIELTRNEFNSLIKPYIEKTITICNDILHESRISKNKLDCIILVGGTTYIPLVREMLLNEFNVELKSSVDPMTVVSIGASIYSYSVENNKEDIITKSEIRKDLIDNEINTKLVYDATSAETEVNVRGHIEKNNNFGVLEVNIENKNKVWNSGWHKIYNYEFEIPVILQEKRKTEFYIYYRDEKGRLLSGNIKSFAITHIGIELDNPPLPHSIGIELYDENNGKDIYEIIFHRKNTKLPCEKDVIYRANRTLKPSDYGEAIEFALWEGENEIADLNRLTGKMQITSENIDRPILENDKINFHIRIDESRKIYVEAHVERIDKYFDWNVYIPERKTIDDEINDNLNSLFQDFTKLSDNIDHELLKSNPNYVEEISGEIDDIYVEVNSDAVKNDMNEKQKLNRGIKDLRIKINTMFKQKEYNKASSLVDEIKESQRRVNNIVTEDGDDNDKRSMEILNKKVEANIKNGNQRFLKKTNDDLWNLGFSILFRKFDYWVYWFNTYKVVPLNKVYNINRFKELLSVGNKAIEAEDIDSLCCVVRELMDLVEDDEISDGKTYLRPGLKK